MKLITRPFINRVTTLLTLVIVFALTFGSSAASATSLKPDNTPSVSLALRAEINLMPLNGVYRIAVDGSEGPMVIRVRDSRNNTLMEKNISDGRQYSGLYSLKALPQGKYTFEFSNNGKTTLKTITL